MYWDLSESVVGACIEVHRQLGPGLLESLYEAALCHELTLRQLPFVRQRTVPVTYKGQQIEQVFRIDLVVDDRLIVEVKAVEKLLPLHEAQALTYLHLTKFQSALLVNFNTVLLHQGLRRLSLTQETPRNSPPPRLPVK